MKIGGGNAGHNGLRSITAHIGNDYAACASASAIPAIKKLVQRYVLQDFAKSERAWRGKLVRRRLPTMPGC